MGAQFPLTIEQFRQIKQDLAEMQVRGDEMFHLMAAGFGESDQRTIRAQELAAAIQRLQWAMERNDAAQTNSPPDNRRTTNV